MLVCLLKVLGRRYRVRLCSRLLAIAALVAGSASAQVSIGTITAGTNPAGIAVNPITNKVYVLNSGSTGTAGLTVIYASTGSTVSVNTGSYPQAVAVNVITNMIYIANHNSNTVTVVDGSSDAVVTTVTVGTGPSAIAVNPNSNTIYVANTTSNTVSVISGASLGSTPVSIAVGTSPVAIAVNPATNFVFVVNSGSGDVRRINTSNHVVSTVAVGTAPQAIAINANTNTIYVANSGSNYVSYFNGTPTSVSTVSVGTGQQAIAVDPVTNQFYVACLNTNSVYSINGSNAATQITNVGTHPNAIAINSQTGIVYVTGRDSNSIYAVPEATNTPGSGVAVGTYPVAVAVNPLTNQIFVSNKNAGSVTELSGLLYVTSTISTGTSPTAIVENPSSQTVYALNTGSGNVTAMSESASPTISTISVGTNPSAALYNPGNATVYVSNSGSSTVSAITGASATSISVGANPGALAYDDSTDNVYVANVGDGSSQGSVSIINGTSANGSISVGVKPIAIAINSGTHLGYVANQGSSSVSIFSTQSNAIVNTLSVSSNPSAIAVNTATSLVYVACPGSNRVYVLSGSATLGTIATSAVPNQISIDSQNNLLYILSSPGSGNGTLLIYAGIPLGATNTSGAVLLATVTVGLNPSALYLNSNANQVYVSNAGSNNVSIINNITYAVSTVATGTSPAALTLSASGNVLYSANSGSGNVTAISALQPVPLNTSIAGLVDSYTVSTQNVFVTSNANPSFTVSVTSGYAGTLPYSSNTTAGSTPPENVFYQVDGTTGPWSLATVDTNSLTNPAVFTIALSSISEGTHTLYIIAVDGNESVSVSSGNYTGNSPEMGNITAYSFSVVSAIASGSISCGSSATQAVTSTVTMASNSNPATVGYTVTYTATVSGSYSTPTGTITFSDGSTVLGTATLSSGTASFSQVGITAGLHAITAAYSGNSTYRASTYNLFETTSGLSTPPSVSFTSSGVVESVYDYNTMSCQAGDYPDEGTRAFRDVDGNVHLMATHSTNRQMIGPTLDSVTHQCPIFYQDDASSDPSLFDDLGWLETFYTSDGINIYGYVSLDYHPSRHPNVPQCLNSSSNPNCWYSTIIQANSTDGGMTFTSPPPGQARFVAGATAQFDNTNAATVGALIPTNIIPMNGAYYMLLAVAANASTTANGGDCLLRTTNLADPAAWRAWDGHGFNIQFVDPYTTPNLVAAQHECTLVDPTHLTWSARTLNILMNGSQATGYIVTMDGTTGVMASTSNDLIHWSTPTTAVTGFLQSSSSCTGSNPCTGNYYFYPSLLDTNSSSMNFNTVNVNASTTYIYLVQWVNSPTNIRNLVRVPITIVQ